MQGFNVFTGGLVYLSPLTQAIVYTWVQDNVDTLVTFYFLKMKACYLPFLMILMSLLLEGTPGALITGSGYVAGHMYLFCDYVYPLVHGGSRLMSTPRLLKQWIPGRPPGAANGSSFGQAFPPRDRQAQTPTQGSSTGASFGRFSRKFQGKGHRLGD